MAKKTERAWDKISSGGEVTLRILGLAGVIYLSYAAYVHGDIFLFIAMVFAVTASYWSNKI